jgi:two-component system, NtrC family, sensor kinase
LPGVHEQIPEDDQSGLQKRLLIIVHPGEQGILADSGHIQQVLINLFNNAIYAILERHGTEGGRLAITGLQTPEKLVEIRVQDNGGGISPENQKKIFSPFFTTKPVGKGTGLGLPVYFGLEENMGGTMEVSSQQGAGTTFTISFPSR